MSHLLDTLTQAVYERVMAQAQRKPYPHHRRSPRAYIKKLRDTSRTVPAVVLPTGPMPDEPWYDPHEDEAEVPLIGEAILAYQKEHSHRAKMTRYQSERAISTFLTHASLHENEPIWCITRESCKRWRQALVELSSGGDALVDRLQPATRNKRVPGAVTIEKRLKMVSHFLAWCVDREYLPTNPMQGLFLPKRLVAGSKVRKTSFSDEELAKIIPALLALPIHDFPRTEFKWAALALLFSGARCMEILQLRHQDVRRVEGVWVFDIKEEEGNHVKNQPSVRLVPVHSQLIQLGFLEWCQRSASTDEAQTSPRLFPAIHPKGSPLVSMWFTRLLKGLNLKRPEVSLHSLRHTVAVKLAQVRTFPALQHRLLGHAIGKGVEERVYLAGLDFKVKELSEALEAVKFPPVV